MTPALIEAVREVLQGVFTAIGLFYTIRVAIPRGVSTLIQKYDRRPAPTPSRETK